MSNNIVNYLLAVVSVDMVENLKEAQIVELKEAFRLFDINKDGYVSSDELVKVMRKLGHHPTESEVEAMIGDVDLDGNGVVDFAEFVSMMARRMSDMDTEKEIRNAFQVIVNKQTNLEIIITKLSFIYFSVI